MWSFNGLVLIAVLLTACAIITPAYAEDRNIEIGDDAYGILLRLEAEGVIKSGLLTTRPISRAEAERLIGEAEGAELSALDKALIEGLKKN